jgi:hypothetical protein
MRGGADTDQLYSISYHCDCWALPCACICNHAQCMVLQKYVHNLASRSNLKLITELFHVGSFENPCCCPCYLCACCGGLGAYMCGLIYKFQLTMCS